MKCKKCGNELKTTDKFCSKCGAKTTKQKSMKKRIGFITGIVITVIGALITILSMGNCAVMFISIIILLIGILLILHSKKSTPQNDNIQYSNQNKTSQIFSNTSSQTLDTQNNNDVQKKDILKPNENTSVQTYKNAFSQPTMTQNFNNIKQSKQNLHIDYTMLNPNEVITKYLTTNHSKCPGGYKYYDYLKAEFDCMLHNLKSVEVELTNTKILRNSSTLFYYEKSKNIVSTTKISSLKDFVSIDVETTGLKPAGNDIIEISAIKFNNFKPSEIFTTLLKPRKCIPSDATAINGITDDMVKNSPKFSEIYDSLKAFIGKTNIVMHNAKFDLKFLFVSGLEIDPTKQFVYDTLELSRRFVKDYDDEPLDNYKLSTVCKELSIYFDGAHRSSTDALATGLLFNELVKIKKDITNLEEI